MTKGDTNQRKRITAKIIRSSVHTSPPKQDGVVNASHDTGQKCAKAWIGADSDDPFVIHWHNKHLYLEKCVATSRRGGQ